MQGIRKLNLAYIGWDSQTFTVWQGQQLVVVKDTVQVLHPLWINIAIKNDPLPLVDLTTHIVNDP